MFIQHQNKTIWIPDEICKDLKETTIFLDGFYVIDGVVVDRITVISAKVQTETGEYLWAEDPRVIVEDLKHNLQRVQISSEVMDFLKNPLKARHTETKEEVKARLMNELQALG